MTIKKKAKQLALTLIGEDQNPQPLIDILVEMAEWQKQQTINKAYDFFEEYLTEEECKFGISEWVEVKSNFDSIDSFIRAFKKYVED